LDNIALHSQGTPDEFQLRSLPRAPESR
jgi:hypothetical protein